MDTRNGGNGGGSGGGVVRRRRTSHETEERMKLLNRRAAAVAWYMHGKRKPGRLDENRRRLVEYTYDLPCITAPSAARHLSRFHAEARWRSHVEAQHAWANFNSPWDCGSSLYDSFELVSVSNQLARCLTAMASSPLPPRTPTVAPPPQPAYIPRTLFFALPQLLIPRKITKKSSSKKRSPLIFPAPGASPQLTCPPPQPPEAPVKKGGFRRALSGLFFKNKNKKSDGDSEAGGSFVSRQQDAPCPPKFSNRASSFTGHNTSRPNIHRH